jgi:hypothetical protein
MHSTAACHTVRTLKAVIVCRLDCRSVVVHVRSVCVTHTDLIRARVTKLGSFSNDKKIKLLDMRRDNTNLKN